MKHLLAGIDIGGTRVKLGIAEPETGKVLNSMVIDTCKDSEAAFLLSVSNALDQCLKELELKKAELIGAGVSIGSYVFADGSIDGMSSFVPFMTEGYPLVQRIEETLGMPVRADNDARLIGLAESRYGAGKGYGRTLTITLGTGVGIGICVDGKPLGDEAFFHLAGHVKVRRGGDIPCLDQEPCYCGLKGCFESTCSGTSLEKYLRDVWDAGMTNQKFFQLAEQGDDEALRHLEWYLGHLTDALNQYVYFYCPDIIILGGGVSKGLIPWKDEIAKRIVAKVHFRQKIVLSISSLMEDSGILGAVSLFYSTGNIIPC
jgi:Transcriptional regulator/sugar kinase